MNINNFLTSLTFITYRYPIPSSISHCLLLAPEQIPDQIQVMPAPVCEVETGSDRFSLFLSEPQETCPMISASFSCSIPTGGAVALEALKCVLRPQRKVKCCPLRASICLSSVTDVSPLSILRTLKPEA